MRGLEIDQINQLVYDRWRKRPAGEVVRWHRRVHESVLETLAATPNGWFGRRERSPHWPADLDGHSAYHRIRDIDAALKR
jgi:hypothetical protein